MNLSQKDWTLQLESDSNAAVLDVRTQQEWSEGIIPNAIKSDIFKTQEFIQTIEKFDKSKNYYVYCKAGSRSEKACHIMNEMGFKNTYNLQGGFMQWQGEVEV